MPEDFISTETPPAGTETTTATTTAAATVIPPDPAMVELVEDLQNLGLDRSKLQALVQKGVTLDNISYNLANNPRAVAEMIRSVAPQTYNKLRDLLTDEYVEQNSDNTSSGEGRTSGAAAAGGQSAGQSALERRLAALETNQQQWASYNQAVQTKADYDKRIDQALENVSKQREAAGQPLSGRDKRSIKALLNASYAEDQVASQRARNGVYVDLGRHLKKVLEDWDGETAGAATSEAAKRESVAAGAGRTVTAASQTTSTSAPPKSLQEDWDLSGEEFAKALRAGKK